jgi:hypothetical protein
MGRTPVRPFYFARRLESTPEWRRREPCCAELRCRTAGPPNQGRIARRLQSGNQTEARCASALPFFSSHQEQSNGGDQNRTRQFRREPAYVFLALPVCASYMTGVELPVMGGVTPTG